MSKRSMLMIVAVLAFNHAYAANPTFTFRLPIAGTKASAESPTPSTPTTPSQPETPKAAKVNVSPTTLDFGTVALNADASKTVSLSNSGGTLAQLVSPTWVAPLSLQASTCGTSLDAGESCTYTFTYSPTEGGVLSQSLLVGNTLAPVQVTASGKSLDTFDLVANTKNVAVDWGVVKLGTSVTKSYTFKNASTTAITNVSAAVEGEGWVIGANTCTGSLAVNAECTVELISQMGAEKAYSATLTVQHLTQEVSGSKAVSVRAEGKQGDPYWGNTLFLSGFSTLTDSKGYPLVLAGSTTLTSSGRFGNGLFMGTGCATVSGTSGLSVAGTDFTAEMQISPTSLSGTQLLLRKRATTSENSPVMLYLSGSTLYGRFTNSSGNVYSVNMGAISSGTFTHIALVRLGNYITGYVNGQPKNSTMVSGSALTNGVDWSIGCDFSGTYTQLFHGTIDDVRVSNMARYTGAFTPPAELPTF